MSPPMQMESLAVFRRRVPAVLISQGVPLYLNSPFLKQDMPPWLVRPHLKPPTDPTPEKQSKC